MNKLFEFRLKQAFSERSITSILHKSHLLSVRDMSQKTSVTNKTLLLIEDEEDIREMLREILIMDGYNVLVARNGREALDILQSHPLPHVILLDMMMPVMNGEEFLKSLEESPTWNAIPVIVMTAASISVQAKSCFALLKKPFRVAQVRAILSKVWQA